MVKCLSCQNCVVSEREVPTFTCVKRISQVFTYADVSLDIPCVIRIDGVLQYKPYKAMKDLIGAL